MPINDLRDEVSVFTEKDLPRPGSTVFWKICAKSVCRQYKIQTGVSPCHPSRFLSLRESKEGKKTCSTNFQKVIYA